MQRLLRARIAAAQMNTDLEMERAEKDYQQKQSEASKKQTLFDQDDIQMDEPTVIIKPKETEPKPPCPSAMPSFLDRFQVQMKEKQQTPQLSSTPAAGMKALSFFSALAQRQPTTTLDIKKPLSSVFKLKKDLGANGKQVSAKKEQPPATNI
jgi:hypothetical protein